jgi:hypothetical protein
MQINHANTHFTAIITVPAQIAAISNLIKVDRKQIVIILKYGSEDLTRLSIPQFLMFLRNILRAILILLMIDDIIMSQTNIYL